MAEPISNQLDRLAGGVEGMALHKNLTQPWCSQIVMLAQPMPNHALSGVDDANVLQQ